MIWFYFAILNSFRPGFSLTLKLDFHGIEFRPKGVSLRASIETLFDYLELDDCRIIVIGSKTRDLEIIKWAGTAFAMPDASSDVSQICQRTIPPGRELDYVVNELLASFQFRNHHRSKNPFTRLSLPPDPFTIIGEKGEFSKNRGL